MTEADAELPGRPVTRRHALATLRHRDFRRLWVGVLLSTTGQQMQFVAAAWHVYLLTDSPLQVGLLGLFRGIPMLILALAGGTIADVVDRKRILLGSQVVLFLMTTSLAVATGGGWVTPTMIYAVMLVAGAAATFDFPARQALISRLVPRNELANAFTLSTLLRETAFIVGPGLGGVLIGQLGLAATYGINGLSFLVAMGAMLGVRSVPTVPTPTTGGWTAVLGGLRFLRGEPLLLWLLLIGLPVNLLAAYSALLPVFARDVLRVGPEGLGLLHAASSAGALVAGVVLGGIGGIRWPIAAILAATATQGLCIVGFGLSSVFGLSLLLLFVTGAASVVAEVHRTTVVQLRTPDELRGRVTALHQVVFQGGPQFGYLWSGAVASLVGPVAALVIGGSAVLLGAVGSSQVPALRRGLRQSDR
jgi:MFS family permease